MSERDSRELKDKISVPATESVEVVEGAEKAAVVEAVRQVQALEAFGMQTAEQLAAKAGEAGVDADVSTALQSVQTEALQAMLQFAGQKFDAIGSDAKLALVKARDWAAHAIRNVIEPRGLPPIPESVEPPPPPPPPLHEFGPYVEDTEEVPDGIPA